MLDVPNLWSKQNKKNTIHLMINELSGRKTFRKCDTITYEWLNVFITSIYNSLLFSTILSANVLFRSVNADEKCNNSLLYKTLRNA